MEKQKTKVLFQGWINVPHSYACVNCFQLVHLFKNYGDLLEIYVEEKDYFRKEWNNVKQLVYTEEYNQILKNLKQWNGEEVDLVYSITYPYNISPFVINGKVIPKCIFYTSEFSELDTSYFTLDHKLGFASDSDITSHLKKYPEKIYFTSPSKWSSRGMIKYDVNNDKNRIITHGADLNILKKNKTNEQRKKIRDFYKIKDTDFLMLNIGAMTQNKGIIQIIQSLNILVNKLNKTHYKLLLKGTGDLYQSRQFLEIYFKSMEEQGFITTNEKNNLLDNHIIFTDKTFTYVRINDIYNAADLYISPYIAEGFGLVPLESLASGLRIVVPKTGSTKEYIEDIYKNGGDDLITYVESQVVELQNNFRQNHIELQDIVNSILQAESKNQNIENYEKMRDYIEENYSWNNVSKLLYEYLEYIKQNSKI